MRIVDMDNFGQRISNEQLLTMKVDLLMPAAIEGVIHADNVDEIQAPIVVEAANLPTTFEADEKLHERGVVVVPDLLANAGGVLVSYLEWVQNRQRHRWTRQRVEMETKEKLQEAWRLVREYAADQNVSYRRAAYAIACDRVKTAIQLRGF